VTERPRAEQDLTVLLADLFSRDELLLLVNRVLGSGVAARLAREESIHALAHATAAETVHRARTHDLLAHVATARPSAVVPVLRVLCAPSLDGPSDIVVAFNPARSEEAAAIWISLFNAGLVVALANDTPWPGESPARVSARVRRSKRLLALVDEDDVAHPRRWLWSELQAARDRGQPTLLGIVGDADLVHDLADEHVDLRMLSTRRRASPRAHPLFNPPADDALDILLKAIQQTAPRPTTSSAPEPRPEPTALPTVIASWRSWWTRPRPPPVIRGLGLGLLVAGLATPWGVWAAGWLDAPASPAPEVAAPASEPSTEPSTEPPPPDWKRTLAAEATALRPALLRVPAGTFTMGSPEGVGDDDEHPAHPVTLPSFLVCETEVTQSHYKEVMGTAPSRCGADGEGCGDDYPVNQVTWNDACAYMNELTERENTARAADQPALTPCYVPSGDTWKWRDSSCTGYRLPTEAEWEYFARAGTRGDYSFDGGEEELGTYAWFGEAFSGYPHPVGKKQPNPWGLVDIHGNVWEWCWDWFGSYSNKPSNMPKGPDSGEGRVLRGGSFSPSARNLRSANRRRSRPSYRDRYYGFRCVRSSPSSVDP